MQLPKRITPDNIKESVVEVKYVSKLPFEVLVGMFFNALDATYKYTNRPPLRPTLLQGNVGNPGQELKIHINNSSLFYNDKISIQLSPNSFVFTCLERYIGWDIYEPEIKKALGQLNTTGHISKWTRVGIRYISEYPGRDLKDCIKFSFSFGLPQVKSDTTAFKSEFFYKESKVVLNLSNLVPIVNYNLSTKQNEITKSSLIDIDVIADNLELDKLEELLYIMSRSHNHEKEVYFGMLKDDFLKSLNPKYN